MRRTVLLTLLVAIAQAGCGGGARSTTEADTHRDEQPLPKADFVSLGDAICRNHESRTKDLESQTIELGRIDSTGKAHRVAGLLRQQAENLSAQANELDALKPPSTDVGAVESILGLVRAKVDVLGAWARAYDDLDTAQIGALQVRIGEAKRQGAQGGPGLWIRGLRAGVSRGPPLGLLPLGALAEWLRSGLQSRLHRFDSGRRAGCVGDGL